MSPQLNSTDKDQVEDIVKTGFESSREANAGLFGEPGVPTLPGSKETIDHIIRTMQGALSKGTIDSLREGGAEVMYQNKLVSPRDRLDLVTRLVNGQPRRMGTEASPQQDLDLDAEDQWIGSYLADNRQPQGEERFRNIRLSPPPSRVQNPTWFGELVHGAQSVTKPQGWDDSSLTSDDRFRIFWEKKRRDGIRGTDIHTWATLTALGLREGKPLDIKFRDDRADTEEKTELHPTFLDEEGFYEFGYTWGSDRTGARWTSPSHFAAIIGYFRPDLRMPCLDMLGILTVKAKQVFETRARGYTEKFKIGPLTYSRSHSYTDTRLLETTAEKVSYPRPDLRFRASFDVPLNLNR
ncbi:MAG: hypothetical protein WC777_02030 [Candidatus Gracilibacteria bacterium]|jgi:hypothetical protein